VEPFTLTITPQGLMLTRKGKRKGQELAWKALVSGDAPSPRVLTHR
jgi:hypothetical protein